MYTHTAQISFCFFFLCLFFLLFPLFVCHCSDDSWNGSSPHKVARKKGPVQQYIAFPINVYRQLCIFLYHIASESSTLHTLARSVKLRAAGRHGKEDVFNLFALFVWIFSSTLAESSIDSCSAWQNVTEMKLLIFLEIYILCNLTEPASSVAPSIKIIGRDLKTRKKREIFCEFPTFITYIFFCFFDGCRAGETKTKISSRWIRIVLFVFYKSIKIVADMA